MSDEPWSYATDELHCTIDATGRIVSVSETWDRMARANGGDGVVAERIVGTPILTHVAGESTRAYVREALGRVQADGLPRVLPYRCDLPGLRRDMELIVEPAGDGLVRMRHRVVATRRLPPGLSPLSGRRRPPLHCSMCNAERRGGTWVPSDGPTGGLGARFGVCPDCAATLERSGRRQG